MKHGFVFLLLVGIAGMVGIAHAQSGGGYRLEWNTIDNGGAAFATGGNYALGGTTGQADAGSLSGGRYALAGGFWVGQVTPAEPPQVQATSPTHEAVDVAIHAPVVITFSEAISANSLAYAVLPDPGGWSSVWSGTGRVVRLSHAPFAYQTRYTVTITAAEDLSGSLLANVPYLWSFTTQAQPAAQHRLYLPLVMRNSG